MKDLGMPPISTATQAALNLKVNPYTESAETTYSNSATILIAHSLGVVPKDWEVILRCKTDENGYSVGDEVRGNFMFFNAGVTLGSFPFADATNIGLITTANPRQLGKTTKAIAILTPDNWRIVACWR
jgi:hypothetical protein